MKTIAKMKYFLIVSLLNVPLANIYSMESVDPKQFESVLLQNKNKETKQAADKIRWAIAGKESETKKDILKAFLPKLDASGSREDLYFFLFKNNKDPMLLETGDRMILKTNLKDIFAHVEKFVTLSIKRAEMSDEIDLLKKQDKTPSRNKEIEDLRNKRANVTDLGIVMIAYKINTLIGSKELFFNKDALSKLIDSYIEYL